MVRLPLCWGSFFNLLWSGQVDCLCLATVFQCVGMTYCTFMRRLVTRTMPAPITRIAPMM